MADNKGRGSSESPWLVARRCLAIINYLQQGPATKQNIITAVYAQFDESSASANTVAKRFEKDKERLANRLGTPIRYDKSVQGYMLDHQERPLLNLPDTHIETLAFLSDTFHNLTPHMRNKFIN